jgi:hypothetical protein
MHDDRGAGTIAILNAEIPRLAFVFFQVVKQGLNTQPHLWWQGEQLRSMRR